MCINNNFMQQQQEQIWSQNTMSASYSQDMEEDTEGMDTGF